MPAPSAAYPALYLYPLNDSFVPKHISLLHNQRVKIGRQTNAKTQPGEKNGYFDSKVLSRQHAEVWEEGSKIFIKDVKSSNGTFINGERLSPEGVESDPYELKSDDIVEFGIDIVGEDNKTIVHHKVAARVVCIFNEQDVQMAARAEMHQFQHSLQQQQQYITPSSQIPSSGLGPGQSGSSLLPNPSGTNASPASSAFSFGANNSQQQQQQQQRRPPAAGHQSMVGMGGMGGSMRPPGKSGLTFDHILSRLQGELQKSRETGAELHTLSGAMHEIHDTLGGGLPPNMSPYSHALPPVRSAQVPPPQPSSSSPLSDPSAVAAAHTHDHSVSDASLSGLRTQLQDTQASLALHVEKIRGLEATLKEQEVIRLEVRMLRDMMEAARRGEDGRGDGLSLSSHSKHLRDEDMTPGFDVDEDDEMLSGGDDDDAMSVSTAVPHELERVDEEDEEHLSGDMIESENGVHVNGILDDDPDVEDITESHEAELDHEDDERRRRRDELGRPHTPEPTNLGLGLKNDFRTKNLRNRHSYRAAHELNGDAITMIDDLHGRLSALSSQLESALELSSTLQAQHASAQETIHALESKVEALEGLVKSKLNTQQVLPLKDSVEETALNGMKSSDKPESEYLSQKITEWKKSVEGQWSNVQEEWGQERERLSRAREEWELKVRQVDSGIEKLEKMQRIVLTKETASWNGNGDAIRHHGSEGLEAPPSPRSLSSDSNKPRRRRSGSRGRSVSRKGSVKAESDLSSVDGVLDKGKSSRAYSSDRDGSKSLATPEASVRNLPSSYSLPLSPTAYEDPSKTNARVSRDSPPLNMQTAIGVLVLGIAAAAVVWRIKPE